MKIFSKFDIQIVQGFEGLDGYTFSWLALYDLISVVVHADLFWKPCVPFENFIVHTT